MGFLTDELYEQYTPSHMKVAFVIAIVFLAVVTSSAPLSGKGATVKIIIEGANLPKPIEITDPEILAEFNVWTGPGTSSSENEGFIVLWSRGVAQPPTGLSRYQVSFYTENKPDPSYVVFYSYDSNAKVGYVYLPGRRDKWYWVDMGSVARGVEGNWFLARPSWNAVVETLVLVSPRNSR